MVSPYSAYRSRRDVEAFLDEMGECSVRLALRTRMRFPRPFGEYHAAMWLARRNWERRERAQRLAARQARDFTTADRIRQELLDTYRVALADGPDGTTWSLAR